ncbi:hypothetical protein GRF59_09995 [Paenibacillus sp. HJL G12]|uniref:peptidylprolyl isomerase n=1 Tax=Paenibacillus dendrobii TaxID=2691084 RepID=A0A7X3IJX0_9BACL|nr:peptidylprolyl isomerase [Paenibacillus dendrobii]MWV43965.1 hypothetical protein [Paenibacillus dendrobii]
MRKTMLLAIPILLFIGCMLAFMAYLGPAKAPGKQDSSDIVAYVNGDAVERREMNLIAERSGLPRANEDQGGLNDPRALEQAVEAKVAQEAAVQFGIIQDSSFSAFLKELKVENERRTAALNNNEPLYGPQQYTEKTYYDYRYAVMMTALKAAWSVKELQASEPVLKEYYQRNRETLAKKHDMIQMYEWIQPKPEPYDAEKLQQAKKEVEALRRQLEAGSDFSLMFRLRSAKPGLTGVLTITEDNYKEISKYRSGDYQAAIELAEGEVSGVLENRESYYLLMAVERQPGGYRSFGDMREEVVRQYADRSFESYLKRMAEEAEVVITGKNSG